MSKIYTLAALATLAIMTLTACGGSSNTICIGDPDNLVCDYKYISQEQHNICYDDPGNILCSGHVFISPNATTWKTEIFKENGAHLADQPTDDDAANTGYFLQSPPPRLDSETRTAHTLTFNSVFNTHSQLKHPNTGVEFFTLDNNRAYASILRNTILGGVLVTRNAPSGIWAGELSFLLASETAPYVGDMDLYIDFGNRRVTSLVPLGGNLPVDHGLSITGQYDDRGVIRGTTVYGQSTTSPPVDNISDPADNGTLSGIIGGEGGVGVFVNTGASYVGGFVVRPPTYKGKTYDGDTHRDNAPNSVNYADWAAADYRWHEPRARNDFLQSNARADGLAGTPTTVINGAAAAATNLGRATLNRNTARYNQNNHALGGDAADAVAFYGAEAGGDRHYYAGITSGTDLGAPLANSNVNGIWHGSLQMVAGTGVTQTYDIELEVNLGAGEWAGEVDAFVRLADRTTTDLYLLIDGFFDTRGVIRGTTTYGEFNHDRTTPPDNSDTDRGVLSGLIGQQGAAAVFHGTEQNADYAGGFVANNYITDGRVEYLDWMNGFDPLAAPSAERANELIAVNGFEAVNLRDEENSLDFSSRVGNGNLGGNANNGVAFYRRDVGEDSHYYAGVFDTTQLGAVPSTSRPSARWVGALSYISDSVAMTNTMILDVNFGERTMNTAVKATSNSDENVYISVDGSFNDQGLISGTTIHGTYAYRGALGAVSDATRGTLSGLIGNDGALGVFISDAQGANPYAGGFVAVNPSP